MVSAVSKSAHRQTHSALGVSAQERKHCSSRRNLKLPTCSSGAPKFQAHCISSRVRQRKPCSSSRNLKLPTCSSFLGLGSELCTTTVSAVRKLDHQQAHSSLEPGMPAQECKPCISSCSPEAAHLLLVLGVGVWVVHDHRVSGLEVEAPPSSADGQQEDEALAVGRVEGAYGCLPAALLDELARLDKQSKKLPLATPGSADGEQEDGALAIGRVEGAYGSLPAALHQ